MAMKSDLRLPTMWKKEAEKAIDDSQFCYENSTLLLDRFERES